jgi:hypothetical protein
MTLLEAYVNPLKSFSDIPNLQSQFNFVEQVLHFTLIFSLRERRLRTSQCPRSAFRKTV